MASKSINKNFFKKWSDDMAYVLGFLYADGNVTHAKNGGHFFSLYSNDRKLVKDILNCLGSEHKISKRSGGKCYRFQVGSKEMCLDLFKLGLIPGKTKRMRLPQIPRKYLGAFVRGFFDGDGNVWSGTIHKNRAKQHETLQIHFTSASYEFLSDLRASLCLRGVGQGSLRKIGQYGRLGYSLRDAFKISKIMYNPPCSLFLRRKKVVFDEFLRA